MFFLVKGLVDIVKFNNDEAFNANDNVDVNQFEQDQSLKKFDPLKESSSIVFVNKDHNPWCLGPISGSLPFFAIPSRVCLRVIAASIIAVTPCDTRILTKQIFEENSARFSGTLVLSR